METLPSLPDDAKSVEDQPNGHEDAGDSAFQLIAELSRGYWSPRILLTAVELDLFTALGSDSLSSRQLADRVGADERGIDLLAKALVAIGLLDLDEGRFVSTAAARRHLDTTSPDDRSAVVRLAGWWWTRWSSLTAIVREGAHAGVDGRTGEIVEDFTLAMHQGKLEVGKLLVERLDLHGVERIIDIGGGAGTFAEALALALPDAQVILVDRPEVLMVARRRLPAELIEERVVLVARDFNAEGIPLAGSPPGGYDLALLSSLLHLQGPEDNARLLSRVHDVLEPGGQVAIREFLVDESGTRPTEAALFAIAMLVTSERGRCYSLEEIKAWLHAAGFGEVSGQELDTPASLITARRA
jgi:ubiquinone/menaquinone biosynthesis C-methylase UbiE